MTWARRLATAAAIKPFVKAWRALSSLTVVTDDTDRERACCSNGYKPGTSEVCRWGMERKRPGPAGSYGAAILRNRLSCALSTFKSHKVIHKTGTHRSLNLSCGTRATPVQTRGTITTARESSSAVCRMVGPMNARHLAVLLMGVLVIFYDSERRRWLNSFQGGCHG